MAGRKILLTILLLALLFGMSSSPDAALIDRGGGLIYDDTRNITWLQDANMAKSMGLSKDGLMTASEAMKWAEDLVYQGYADWRLPDARNPDGSIPKYGWEARTSEMGHLFFEELGNSATVNIFDPSGLKNSGPFLNLQPFRYWSSTKYHIPSDFWWYFNFGVGYQWDGLASAGSYAWAVRDGDSRPLNQSGTPNPPSYAPASAPSVIGIPETEVATVRDPSVSIFAYRGYWWRWFEGRWYRSSSYRGPWSYVRPETVPAALVELPPEYKKHLSQK